MKKVLLTLITIIISLPHFAQGSSQSRNILDKAYANYENSKGIKIEFSFAASENKTVHMQQTGVAMVKGNKFKVETKDIETWYDGKTQWILLKEYNEVNISEPSIEEVASISPTALLGMYKSGYTLSEPINSKVNGKDASAITLTPTNSKSDFKQITVAIDKSNQTIVQVLLTLKNGVDNKIDITSYNTNYNFNDADFVFNKTKHPDVEIIDLR